MNKFVCTFIFLLFTLELYCQDDRPKPVWVNKLPYISSRIEGVGFSSSASTPDSNRVIAEQRAREELAKFMKISVSSTFKDTTIYTRRDDDETERHTVRQDIQTKVDNVFLRNSKIGDTWYDEKNKTYYVYAYIEWTNFEKEMEVYKSIVLDYLRNGDAAEENGDIEKALREYANGLRETEGIHPFYFETEIDGKKEYLPSLMTRKIENCFARFEVHLRSGSQTGEYQKSLSKPVEANVLYDNKSIANVPVLFKFTKGNGILRINGIENTKSLSTKTDDRGEAACEVTKVLSVNKTNILTVQMDFKSIFSDSWEEYVNRFKNRLSSRYVFSSYFVPVVSSNLMVSLNGSFDEQEFWEGQQAQVRISTNEGCALNLFLINARGELQCLQEGIALQAEQSGAGWKIEREGDRWSFSFTTTFTADAGEGTETLVCIATPLGEAIGEEGRKYSKEEILERLNEKFRIDEYEINTISYVIKK